MKKTIPFLLLLFFGLTCSLFSQSSSSFNYHYSTILLDSTYSSRDNETMEKYITHLQKQLSAKMDIVIGKSVTTLSSYPPASPLSNLLTDILLQFGNRYCIEKFGHSADVSLLNFGGIRTSIPEGDITVGTVYQISPFDNVVVIIDLKGKELIKIFESFTYERNQPYAGLQITYKDDLPVKLLINNEDIEPEKIYRLVTVDFIMTGGDRIISPETVFENIYLTGAIFRDVIIDGIKMKTAEEKMIEADDNNESRVRR